MFLFKKLMVKFIKREFVFGFMDRSILAGIGAFSLCTLTACHSNVLVRWDDRDRETFFAYGVGVLEDMSEESARVVRYPGEFTETIRTSYDFERDGEPVRDFYRRTILMDGEGFVVEFSNAVDFDCDGFDEYTLVSRFSGEVFPGHRQPFEVVINGKVASDSNILYEGKLKIVDMSSAQTVGSADIENGRLVNEEEYVYELGLPQDGFELGMSLAKSSKQD